MVDSTSRVARRPTGSLQLAGFTLTVVDGLDRGLTIRIEGRAARIGKGAECDLRLTDATVSRTHTLISPGPDGYLVEDLGSTNGTRVNGAKVQSAEVDAACRIQAGDSVIEFQPVTRKLSTRPAAAPQLGGMLGESDAMGPVFGLLRQVAPTEATVVITGETGTGKELAARALHALSPRASGPFEVVDCGNMDRELLGSELFGHTRGAFTGAVAPRRGAFDRADGGTLFLDEIGELPSEIQTRLLGVLQRREIRPLGADAAHPVNTRVVAATHRDLDAMVAAGSFREDLYFRLAVITLELPPLRDRKSDLPLLAEHFLRELSPGAPASLTRGAIAHLEAQAWKGNIRELRNTIQRALVLSGGAAITEAHLSSPARKPAATSAAAPLTLEAAEERLIREALARNRGNKQATARELGIAKETLRRKLKAYQLGGDDPDD